ncbi:hypothetical protein BOTBODRAFT_182361 [Botryobasidium botryosum FD-172 SS1]|uniref:Uncharacterized protein n=1 Tax=Botryobasidium botryosum (strain FD-172 SS1) TaxID=930990 RepID=A0A067LR00_BOTB1|nr:hypothetical protein BOTBODRAFT_182361 [Botryobasidium botryosum FD-172 SS1]
MASHNTTIPFTLVKVDAPFGDRSTPSAMGHPEENIPPFIDLEDDDEIPPLVDCEEDDEIPPLADREEDEIPRSMSFGCPGCRIAMAPPLDPEDEDEIPPLEPLDVPFHRVVVSYDVACQLIPKVHPIVHADEVITFTTDEMGSAHGTSGPQISGDLEEGWDT